MLSKISKASLRRGFLYEQERNLMKYSRQNFEGLDFDINIHPDRTFDLTDFGVKTLEDRYLTEEETNPQEAFARVACFFSDSEDMAQRMYDYVSKRWMMFSTPVLANGGTERGLPISCFLNNVEDTRESILGHYTENGWLSSMGGGIGGYWGDVRPMGSAISRGGKSTGVIPFIKMVDSQMMAFMQGSTRRGSYAAYMDLSHPEIEEFLLLRTPSSGDVNRRCMNVGFHHAVVIPDDFMHRVAGALPDEWDLIDPKDGKVVKTVSAKELWKKILSTRHETGEPYIMFGDSVNKAMPEEQKALGLSVKQSNLCSEITLTTGTDHHGKKRTAVCCLSSLNAEQWSEWKDDEQFLPDVVRFLDNILTYFIDEAEELPDATYSALRERSIGIGMMGWHSLLQKNKIPFEGALAVSLNRKLFAHVKTHTEAASRELAKERGACPDSIEGGDGTKRNMHLLAIAPNASSADICGTSAGIEPMMANYYNKKTLSGFGMMWNPYLKTLLESKGKFDQDTQISIIQNEGSVQHLECLDQWEKDIFKTAKELNQLWLVQHAADRQQYVCQAQSLNLFFSSRLDKKTFHDVHMSAWKLGVKCLYYVRTGEHRKAEVASGALQEDKLKDFEPDECFACQG